MIIDQNGNEITNPDLSLGYLVTEEKTVEVPAVEGSPAVYREEVIWQGSNPDDKLVKRVVVTPAVAARPAYTKTIRVQKYVPYTEAELEERREAEEAAKAEAEAEAAKRAEQEAWLEAAPDALLEVAALAATNEERLDTHEDALVELASMIEGE